MKLVKRFFNWLKSLIGNLMKNGRGGNAAGSFESKQIIRIRKEVDLDTDGNEISGSVIYKVLDSFGKVIKESTSIIEIYYWLKENENVQKYKLG